MTVIDQYTSHVLGQGQVNSQASGADFGAQVGAAEQNLGAAGEYLGQKVFEAKEAQDVTNVHVEMAKKRAEWTQTLKDRANQATPGDDTFAPTLMGDMDKDLTSLSDKVTTRRGQQTLQSLSANLSSEFGQRAIGIQSDLAGQAAANSYSELVKASGTTVYNDQSQYGAVLAEAKLAITNGSGMFGKIPQTSRDKFMAEIKNDISFAASRGFARTDPTGLLQSVAPDQLAQFQPEKKVLEINTAPGGKVNISAPAMKWSPYVTTAAAARGVNPNILLAQIDKESAGNPNAVNNGDIQVTGSASVGLAQFQPGTAKQYGIDPTDPRQSIKGQAAYMSDLLTKYSGDYNKSLAAYNWGPGNLDKSMQRWGNDWQSHLPASTREYVSTIMANAGQTVAPGQSAAGAPATGDTPGQVAAPEQPGATGQPETRAPVNSTLPFFRDLPWLHQDQVVKEAVQLQHMKMTMAEHQRAQAEQQIKKVQESKVNGYQQQILDPDKYGQFDVTKVNDDNTIDSAQKLHLVQTAMTVDRQNRDPKNHPGEVNRLMTDISAGYDDPTKAYNANDAKESLRMGQINANEFVFLEGQVEKMRDGSGNSFQRQVNMANKKAEDMFMKDFTATLPGGAAYASDALYRFRFDLDKNISDLRKANKDPSSLLDPTSRDYMLTPERMKTYMPQAMQLMQDQAGKVAAEQKKALPSYTDHDKIPVGGLYTAPDGSVRVKNAPARRGAEGSW